MVAHKVIDSTKNVGEKSQSRVLLEACLKQSTAQITAAEKECNELFHAEFELNGVFPNLFSTRVTDCWAGLPSRISRSEWCITPTFIIIIKE